MTRAYVDPIAVERAAVGDHVHVTPLERTAAVQLLSRRGLSAPQIATLLRVTPRTVERCRSRREVEVSPIG